MLARGSTPALLIEVEPPARLLPHVPYLTRAAACYTWGADGRYGSPLVLVSVFLPPDLPVATAALAAQHLKVAREAAMRGVVRLEFAGTGVRLLCPELPATLRKVIPDWLNWAPFA